jgi:hypothetical protein
MVQSKYGCGHRFILHENSGLTENIVLKFPCPGCRSKRPFVRESDPEAQGGKALGVAEDGAIHIYSTRHLGLKRHKRSRAMIRASKGKGGIVRVKV